MQKKLITSVTYQYREKYYSTKIKKNELLRELIAKKKLKQHELKLGIEDKIWSNEIKCRIETLRCKSRHIEQRLDRAT